MDVGRFPNPIRQSEECVYCELGAVEEDVAVIEHDLFVCLYVSCGTSINIVLEISLSYALTGGEKPDSILTIDEFDYRCEDPNQHMQIWDSL